MKSVCCLLFLFLAVGLVTVSTRAENITPVESEWFEKKIRPLLSKHCYECHSVEATKIKGGLVLDSKSGWEAGGDSGEAIVPGFPEKSLIVELIRHSDPKMQMPPKNQLREEEIEALEEWIRMGAPDPRKEGKLAQKTEIDWEKGREHWAFRPVTRPEAPQVEDKDWVRSDLDRFILARREAADVGHAPDADRFTLIRRVTLDLTGLPPTTDEVAAFISDSRTDDEALASVVDRLLKSERFGERWGRHWLDVVRYADSVGRTRNVPFPYAWRYRNYVIDAFNQDKPFDQFLTEQLAGDLLPAEDGKKRAENLVATGFLALGSMDLNERDAEQFMLDRVDDQVDTFGRAFMALTTGCARCHDHKFDPLAQTDYYALAGIFASTQTLSGLRNKGGNGNYFDPGLLAKLEPGSVPHRATPGNSNASARVAELLSKVENLEQQVKQKKGKAPALRAELVEARRELRALQQGNDMLVGVPKKKKNGKEGPTVDLDAPLAMSATDGKIADLALRVRGEPDIHGDLIARGFPVVFHSEATSSVIPEDSSGRLQLAAWLTSQSHPLTARVMSNRVWSHLFGRGIVPTRDNFGVAGEAPTHPELLDHLASHFVSSGWSIKSLVREIMLSRTYRLSSGHIDEWAKRDEANSLYWRMNLRRLEAETIRDSFLATGGTLDLKRPEGAPFDKAIAASLAKGGKRGSSGDDVLSRPVRSVYLPIFRSRLPGMFTVFDFAEPDQVNGQRDVTTVATQALFLLNNEFVIDSARRAARRILDQPGLSSEAARVEYAYAYTLCRRPSESERANALAYLQTGGQDREKNWSAFLQALFSSAEFRYVK